MNSADAPPSVSASAADGSAEARIAKTGVKPTPWHSKLLCARRLPLYLAILGVVLALPSLWAGLEADDYFHRAALLPMTEFPDLNTPPLELFAFTNGDAERMQRIMDLGIAPWWTLLELRMAFCRPLTAFTHWLDYRLWPHTPMLMHVQNLVWFGALVFAAAVYYRRIMGWTVVAGLAALLFAVDDGHATPAGWIAGRNALTSMFFGLCCLIAHDRWRRDAWTWGALWGPIALLAALLSAEAGVSTFAYLVPYAAFIDRGRWWPRVRALAPYFVILIGWRIVWALRGYGVHGVGAYVDPLGNPLAFAVSVANIAPILLLGQWATPPSDLYILYDIFMPGSARWVGWGAVGVLAMMALIMVPHLRRDRTAKFWASGMLLSLVPICASANFPMDRLLVFVSLGAMGLLGQFLIAVYEHVRRRRQASGDVAPVARRLPAMVLAGSFVLLHLVIAPVATLGRAAAPAGPKSFTEQFYVDFPDDADLAGRDVVIINAPSAGLAGMLPLLRATAGTTLPRRVRMLGPSLSALSVTREDARTLIIDPDDGYLHWAYDRLVRSEAFPFETGDRIEVEGMTVVIQDATPDGRPAVVAFRFDAPLDDPAFVWLQWRDGRFVSFSPPAVGQTIRTARTMPKMAG